MNGMWFLVGDIFWILANDLIHRVVPSAVTVGEDRWMIFTPSWSPSKMVKAAMAGCEWHAYLVLLVEWDGRAGS